MARERYTSEVMPNTSVGFRKKRDGGGEARKRDTLQRREDESDAREEQRTVNTLLQRHGLRQIIGESPAFLSLKESLSRVACYDVGVLITGETGTGKEVVARALHYLSPRARQPFVPVNCGALPVDLVENELFGHERGAYTSADQTEPGLVQEAQNGTLFLDEIDSLPATAQVKLLRFLQEKEYRTVGSAKTHRANVRIIGATNADVATAVQTGKLRQDLYYRLNVISLTLPPLRDRGEDILLLANHFLTEYSTEFNKPRPQFSASALHHLCCYPWPGNVRELEHAVERAVVLTDDTTITEYDLFSGGVVAAPARLSFKEAKAAAVARFERTYLVALLTEHHGNISQAAHAAKKHRRAFWQLVRKYNISLPRSSPV